MPLSSIKAIKRASEIPDYSLILRHQIRQQYASRSYLSFITEGRMGKRTDVHKDAVL